MRRLAHLVLPLLVFCAGLAAGSWFSIGRRASSFAAGVDQRLAEKADATPAAGAEIKRGFSTDDDMLTAIMSAVAEDEPLLRAHRLHDLFARLNSAELAVLFARAVKVDDRARRGALLPALLARWAALDPAGAAGAVRPYRDQFRRKGQVDWQSVDTAVATAWTQAQPDAALAEAMNAPDAPWALATAWNALQTLADGDPARQVEALARMPASRLRNGLCEDALSLLAEKDSAAAEAHLDLVPEPRERARVQAEILGKLAERDPAAALARLATLAPDLTPGTAGKQLVNSILRAAAKKDATSALAAVNGLPEELRTNALGAALVGWAGEHPVDALTWAAKNGVDVADAKAIQVFGSDGSAGWNSLVGTAFETDRAKTLAWLRAQPPSKERDAMFAEGIWRGTLDEKMEIYAQLTPEGRASAAGHMVQFSMQDGGPEKIEPWVKAQPPGAARRSAILTLAYSQAANAPEKIDTLADAWPAGPDRDAAMRGIASSLSNNSTPQRALDFARRIGDPTQREMSIEQTARSWLYGDEPAARAWITSAPEFSAEQKRVLLRQFDER